VKTLLPCLLWFVLATTSFGDFIGPKPGRYSGMAIVTSSDGLFPKGEWCDIYVEVFADGSFSIHQIYSLVNPYQQHPEIASKGTIAGDGTCSVQISLSDTPYSAQLVVTGDSFVLTHTDIPRDFGLLPAVSRKFEYTLRKSSKPTIP